jgi:hypothetical protein
MIRCGRSGAAPQIRTQGSSVHDTETQACEIELEMRLDPSCHPLANGGTQNACISDSRYGQVTPRTCILACRVLPHNTFNACREKVPRVSILCSLQDVDRTLGVRYLDVAVANAMFSLISAKRAKGGLIDGFSRNSINYLVASTSHPQPLIRSEAKGALKHEMRKLQGLKL